MSIYHVLKFSAAQVYKTGPINTVIFLRSGDFILTHPEQLSDLQLLFVVSYRCKISISYIIYLLYLQRLYSDFQISPISENGKETNCYALCQTLEK